MKTFALKLPAGTRRTAVILVLAALVALAGCLWTMTPAPRAWCRGKCQYGNILCLFVFDDAIAPLRFSVSQ